MSAESVTARVLRRVRRLVPPQDFRSLIQRFRGLSGIEIGGPSAVFRRWNLWPVYPLVAAVDQYNFAAHTIWSGPPRRRSLQDRVTGPQPRGRQVIGEASEMSSIDAASYDFVLASHVLEHVANPLRALREWSRVLKPGGWLVLVVPHRDGTFDHRRPVTKLAHILEDNERGVSEADETHLTEILSLHDLSRDPGAGAREAFEARARRNFEFRSLHHHVFDTELAVNVVDRAGLCLAYVDIERPFHICIIAATPADAAAARERTTHNSRFLAPTATWRARTTFPSDRTSHAERSS